jgi:hypothetical protein
MPRPAGARYDRGMRPFQFLAEAATVVERLAGT